MMIKKVKYLGETSFLELTHGEIYKVLSVERSWYRVIDDSGEDYHILLKILKLWKKYSHEEQGAWPIIVRF